MQSKFKRIKKDGSEIDVAGNLPVVVNSLATIMSPDYANMESTNRLPTQTSVWTVGRDGYVYASARGLTRTSYYTQVYINDVCVSSIPNWDYDTAETTVVVLPVSKGDVVRFNTSNYASQYYTCYFIPPKFSIIPVSNPIIDASGDYSLIEKPVLVNDNGLIRQKNDYDGSPIFQKFVTGVYNSVANTVVSTPLGVTVKRLINAEGTCGMTSTTTQIAIGFSTGVSNRLGYVQRNDNGDLYLSTNQGSAISNLPYYINLTYTKL